MMTLSAAAQVTGGELVDADANFEGVCTDSRSVGAGALFIALKGEHFDGHDYVTAALRAGAAAALVEASWAEAQRVRGLPLLAVADTRLALGEIAASWRGRFGLPLIGVTGSNGKTTVKEMCASRSAQGEGRARSRHRAPRPRTPTARPPTAPR